MKMNRMKVNRMKARKKKMYITIGIFLILLGALLIWFRISYSPVKNQFKKDIRLLMERNQLDTKGEVFTKEEFSHLPKVIQNYIEYCGYIGTEKMSNVMMEYHDVNFSQGLNGPTMKIGYTQYNFVNKPCRMALIDSFMFGIPFEGYDYYQNGSGGMKGVIAKVITLFDQTGLEMDKACLVTFLAESMFVPTTLLQDYITFEELDDYRVKATITYEGQTASGIFTFNEQYEMISFTTNDRGVANADGTMEYVPWSALCSEYINSDNGIMQPTKFQAVWNYPDNDFIYFDGIISKITYHERVQNSGQ